MKKLSSPLRQANIEFYLDELLRECWLPASRENRVRAGDELSVQLQSCLRSLPWNVSWRIYSGAAEMYCAIARASTSIFRGPWRIALDVYFLNSISIIIAAGTWGRTEGHRWRLTDVLDVSSSTTQWLSDHCFPASRGRMYLPNVESWRSSPLSGSDL